MKRSFYESPKPGWLMKLLWKAAGADAYLLSRSTYNDQAKYACLGGVVVATGFMAALAGGYAMYTIFAPGDSALVDETHIPTAGMAVVFGIIWGLIIFNLDRFIVASSGVGDGTEAIKWSEFMGALPRVLMGVIIAITISKPVEIRMFKTEIDTALYEKQIVKQKEFENATRSTFEESFAGLERRKNELDAKRDALVTALNKAEAEFADEIGGRNAAGRGIGPNAKAFQATIVKYEKKIKDFDRVNASKFASIEEEHVALEEELKGLLGQNKKVAAGLNGLLERIKLAHEIAGFWISLFITLLFMAIELTPIFFKMMLTKSPYNYMSDNTKELMLAEAGIEVEKNYFKNKKGQDRHRIIYHAAREELGKKKDFILAQEKLNEAIIDKWVSQELENVNANLEDYIAVKKEA